MLLHLLSYAIFGLALYYAGSLATLLHARWTDGTEARRFVAAT